MNLRKDIKCPFRDLAGRTDDTVDKLADRRPSQRLDNVQKPRRKDTKQVKGSLLCPVTSRVKLRTA